MTFRALSADPKNKKSFSHGKMSQFFMQHMWQDHAREDQRGLYE